MEIKNPTTTTTFQVNKVSVLLTTEKKNMAQNLN
jgi:hypothetical protein